MNATPTLFRRFVRNDDAGGNVPELKTARIEFSGVTNASVSVRNEEVDGKNYLVVPLVAITEGVHTGSEGPILYLEEELNKFVSNNNHRPSVIWHPEDGSAADLANLKKSKVGFTMNAVWDKKKKRLKMEAFLDPTKTEEMAPVVIENIKNKQPTEVSTGYDLQIEEKSGTWKDGSKYVGIARNLHLDHLAILPEGQGACSVKKGAGLLRNSDNAAVWDGIEAMLPDGQEAEASLMPIAARSVAFALRVFHADRSVENALSFSDVSCKLMCALSAKYGSPGEYWRGYVREVYPDKVIFCSDGKCYSIGYKTSDTDVTLTGSEIEVTPTTEYVAVSNAEKRSELAGSSASVKPPGTRDSTMPFNKAEHVTALIAAGVFNADKKDWLEKQDDALLEAIKVPAPAGDPTKVVADKLQNSDATIKTVVDKVTHSWKEWVASLPKDAQRVQNSMYASYVKEMTETIATIKNAKGNKFTDDELSAMDPELLKKMAATLKDSAVTNADPDEDDEDETPFGGVFFGGMAGAAVTNAGKKGSGGGKMPTPEDSPVIPNLYREKAAK